MAAEMFGCSCGFLCVESQLAKTQGACPKCGLRTAYYRAKYQTDDAEQTQFHVPVLKR